MFTIEEITLIKIYYDLTPSKEQIIQQLKDVQPHFNEDEEEMKELTSTVIKKLIAIDDDAFLKINLNISLH